MKTIDERTVELTDAETQAHTWFHEYLDAGHGIPTAAKLALNRMRTIEPPDHAFVLWLSEETVTWWRDQFIVRKKWRLR